MQRIRFYYVLELQYLGFRFHGWQKQPGLKTVERMLERSVAYVLDRKFKLLISGRTDAMVSASGTFVELFVDDRPLEKEAFLAVLNKNLPQDLRVLSIQETTADFNIIQHPKVKEYLYFFCFGEKYHPFCAPFMTNIQGRLDIAMMKEGARLFEGKHDFWSYTFKPQSKTQTEGDIMNCEIVKNKILKANFFPTESFVLRIQSEGFKRHQIRLIMGILIELGKGEVNLDFIKETLNPENKMKLTYVAPASGLVLNSIEFKENGIPS